MGYLYTKVLTHLVMPLGSGGAVILLGVMASALRRRRLGAGLSLIGLLWIWLWSTPVFSDWVRRSLEGRFPPVAIEALPNADAILVLGGAVEGAVAPRLYPDLDASADRVWHAARLFLARKAPVVILSGGRLPWDENQGPEADAMLQFLIDLGVPREKVRLETRSGNTYENARETQSLLKAEGWKKVLLVTSALHMRRAQATFESAEVDVVPVATDYEVEAQPRWTLLDFLPDAGALEGSSRALKEYLGLWVYRLRGWAA
jgi:uncharacterized SAM-binding protein YcdF (DUF218 family)